MILTWEYVSIIPLSRCENTSISQSHRVKRTSTGKQASALNIKPHTEREAMVTVGQCAGLGLHTNKT